MSVPKGVCARPPRPEKPAEMKNLKGHRPCPECKRVLISQVAFRCFRCGERDVDFDILDRLIAKGITSPRAQESRK